MKLIDRHEFTNGKAFEIYYLDAEDIARHNLPECDVIGFCYDDERKGTQLFAMLFLIKSLITLSGKSQST